eukprot:357092-Chlamydomonas_euryale.AAC.2
MEVGRENRHFLLSKMVLNDAPARVLQCGTGQAQEDDARTPASTLLFLPPLRATLARFHTSAAMRHQLDAAHERLADVRLVRQQALAEAQHCHDGLLDERRINVTAVAKDGMKVPGKAAGGGGKGVAVVKVLASGGRHVW